MKRAVLLLAFAGATASAQDSSFSSLRLRGAVLLLPVIGHLADDWRARPGMQIEAASNVGRSEIAVSVGRIGFEALASRPAFAETHISLSITRPILEGGRVGLSAGARLTDVRMDFEDPAIVEGLRTEEEVMLSVVGRGHVALGRRARLFVEATAGRLMLSTRTPTVGIAAGAERGFVMPGWLRDVLR